MAKKKVNPRVMKKVKTPVKSAKTTMKKPAVKALKKPAKTMKKTGKPSQAIAIVALILNILILPGLGSVIGGKTREGIWQIVLFLVGIPLTLILVGIPMIIAAWVWGIITGVKLIQESQ